MTKRKIGERATILFDSIDLEILKKLRIAKAFGKYGEYNGLGVLDLVEEMKIKHNSLKPHLDKLRYLKLVSAYKDSEGKIRICSEIESIKFAEEVDILREALTGEEYKAELKRLEDIEVLEKYLNLVKDYSLNEEIAKEIEFDLRKKKEVQTINYATELKRLKANEKLTEEVIAERKEQTKAEKK